MSERFKSATVLWNDPRTVVAVVFAIIVTAAIVTLQMVERTGVFDPTTLRIFYRLFLFQDYPATLLIIVALLASFLPALQTAGWRMAALVGDHPGWAAASALALLVGGTRWVYLAQPLAMDEYAPLMQSAAFAAGELTGRFPPALLDWLVFPSFQGHFIKVARETGEIASSYWPGFAVLLTPFTAAGVPWLCNPVLGAVGLLLVFRQARDLTASTAAAGAALLFMLFSATFVVNAISFYSMTAHVVCNAAFALLVWNRSRLSAVMAGAAGGLALTLHNPVPHMLFAAPWLLWMIADREARKRLPWVVLGYLPFVAAGYGWHFMLRDLVGILPAGATNSSARPLVAETIAELRGVIQWPAPALLYTRLIGLAKVWIWSAPLLPVLAMIGAWQWRREPRVRLLFASAVFTFIGFLFVPVDQGHGWGFRYFQSAWFVLPVLASLTIVVPAGGLRHSTELVGKPLPGVGLGAALAGALLVLPFLLFEVHGFIRSHLAQMPVASQGTTRVVIINPFGAYYSQDLAQNDPFLRGPVIRMVTRGRTADREMMAQHFPELVLLESQYRGTVWGYSDGAVSASASVAVGRGEHRQQE